MKEFDVKHGIDDEVFIILNKTIIKTKIESFRITQSRPYTRGEDMKEMDGIVIEYLVVVKDVHYGLSHQTSYEWYNQDDVYTDKEELIRRIN